MIRDSPNGLLVPPADPHALAYSMDRIVSDSRLRRKLVEGGKRSCREYSWEKVARKTMEVYDYVCG